jgi:zinc and cadmium transporter
VGGAVIGAAFIIDVRLGIATAADEAVHELPQELGDFGILVHSGWTRIQALVFNVASASTIFIGGFAAYFVSPYLPVAPLLAFAAGNFIYIALADLVPELTTEPTAHGTLANLLGMAAGLGLLLAPAVFA